MALKLGRTGNNPCPLDVVLAEFHKCFSQPYCLPLTFHPEKGDLVSESTVVNIKFDATTACEESTVLQVVRDESVDRGFLLTGGVLGNQLFAS